MKGKIRTISENVVYDNEYATLYDDDVIFPSGHLGKYLKFVWKAPFGVAVLPVFAGSAFLIKNHRYKEQKVSVEVPQGFGEDDTKRENDARRELLEETGLVAKELQPLGSVGGNYKTFLYVAWLQEFPNFSDAHKEGGEAITGLVQVSLQDVTSGNIFDMGIFDPISQVLLMRYFLL